MSAPVLRRASRAATKMRIALAGTSGSGKTYSALLMASGMAPWEKVALIDTENGSGDLYAHLGPYNVITLNAPFTPERYIEAIAACEAAGMEVIVIDSMTHEWDGKGGILEIKDNMSGNSFTNWGKITPRHNAFINKILGSSAHMICTMRSKQDYVLVEKNGKQTPQKVGLKAITREGVEYEFTLVLDIDINHMATASKDRTEIFMKPGSDIVIPEKLSADTGKRLMEWAAQGVAAPHSEQPVPEPIAPPRAASLGEGALKPETMERIIAQWKRYCALHGIDQSNSAKVGSELTLAKYQKRTIAELTDGEGQAFESFLSNESWKVEQSMKEDSEPSEPVPAAKPLGKIRPDQTKKLFAVWNEYAKVAGISSDASTTHRKALLNEMFGVDSTTKLNETQADEFIARVQADTQEARQ